jgi:hypothetical protein
MIFVVMGIIGITTYWLLKRFTKLKRKRRYGFTVAITLASYGYPFGIWGYLNIRRFGWELILVLLTPLIMYFLVQPAIPDED